MPRIQFSPVALKRLDQLIDFHELPDDTRARVVRSVQHLSEFPLAGHQLAGEWEGYRYVLGPWMWMLIVYELIDDELVAIVGVEDSRREGAVTGRR